MNDIKKIISNIKVSLLFIFRNKILRIISLILIIGAMYTVYHAIGINQDIERFDTLKEILKVFDQMTYFILIIYLFMLHYSIRNTELSSVIMTKPFPFNKYYFSVILSPVVLATFISFIILLIGIMLFPVLSIDFQPGFIFARLTTFFSIGIDLVYLGLLATLFRFIFSFFIFFVSTDYFLLTIIKDSNMEKSKNIFSSIFNKLVDIVYFIRPYRDIFKDKLANLNTSFLLSSGDLSFILYKGIYLIIILIISYLLLGLLPNNIKRKIIHK